VGLAVVLAVCAFLERLRAYRCDIRLHQTAKGVSESYEALVKLLETIEHFLKHLDINADIPLTPATNEIVVKTLVELLSTLALATKELKQGRPSKSFLADLLRCSVLRRGIRKTPFWRKGRRRGLTTTRSTHLRRSSVDHD
jgi:hypothetical protein